ncbi:MAG TPA: hypothetical protein VLF38_04820, partial [Nocardioides sp.]
MRQVAVVIVPVWASALAAWNLMIAALVRVPATPSTTPALQPRSLRRFCADRIVRGGSGVVVGVGVGVVVTVGVGLGVVVVVVVVGVALVVVKAVLAGELVEVLAELVDVDALGDAEVVAVVDELA